MIILVPVSRFRVKYDVAEGTPYSQLDRLLLEAIGGGAATLEALQHTFRIHPRLLIQSLVSLTQTGWVALGSASDQQFALTSSGEQALINNNIPPQIKIASRITYVLLERVTGAVMQEGQVQYVAKHVLEQKGLWDKDVCLRGEVYSDKLDEAELHHTLPRRQGQRLYWVGPIELVSKFDHFLVIDVDIDRERLLNLPTWLELALKPFAVEKARELLKRNSSGEGLLERDKIIEHIRRGRTIPTADFEDQLSMERVARSSISLITTTAQHLELLEKALITARSLVLICSTEIEIQALESIKSAIMAALQRGVDIHVLRGYKSTTENLDWLKKTAYDSRQSKTSGKLRFTSKTAQCNARLLIWDRPDGGFTSVMSSFDWLTHQSEQSTSDHHVGVIVTAPGFVSELARSVASLWLTAPGEALSSVPDRWRRVAAALDELTQAEEIQGTPLVKMASVRVVYGREHFSLLRQLILETDGELILSSAAIGEAAAGTVHLLASRQHMPVGPQVYFDALSISSDALEFVAQQIAQMDGKLEHVSGLRGNVVTTAHRAIVTSLAPLSVSISPDAPIKELGILIEANDELVGEVRRAII